MVQFGSVQVSIFLNGSVPNRFGSKPVRFGPSRTEPNRTEPLPIVNLRHQNEGLLRMHGLCSIKGVVVVRNDIGKKKQLMIKKEM